MASKGVLLSMAENEKICKNCAYAVARSDATRFKWCKILCTLERPNDGRWIPYKYPTDSCGAFMATARPTDG